MITYFLAAAFGIVYYVTTLKVVKLRRKNKVSLGVGDNESLLAITSAHNNLTQYTPLLIVLFFLCESSGLISNIVLIPLALIIITGRVLHFKGMTQDKMNFSLRVKGMKLTLFPILAMSIMLVVTQLISLFK